ncbi:transposase [Blastochloris sulfoviridis]|uniref:transposase n=1 Tax=Blastochloris sulfoviridis TaxID=50712 RepID=UPI003CCC76A3
MPRKTNMRAAMNAILYLLRTKCPWRDLPKDGFPPARPSKAPSASSSVRVCGTRSGPSCTSRCANVVRQRLGREVSPRLRSSTASRRSRRKKGRQRRRGERGGGSSRTTNRTTPFIRAPARPADRGRLAHQLPPVGFEREDSR